MDLRTGSPTAERRTWSRSLRGPILARPPSSCADDDDRLCFPSASSPRSSKAGKKESTGHRPNPLCQPCATLSSNLSLNHRLNVAHTAGNGFPTTSGMSRSAKVVLVEGGYRQVQNELANMRRQGELPYDWLADNTRWMRKPTIDWAVDNRREAGIDN